MLGLPLKTDRQTDSERRTEREKEMGGWKEKRRVKPVKSAACGDVCIDAERGFHQLGRGENLRGRYEEEGAGRGHS